MNEAKIHGKVVVITGAMSEVKRVAAEIAAKEPRIDVLVNNAGAIFSHRAVTNEGLERTFALNHMSFSS